MASSIKIGDAYIEVNANTKPAEQAINKGIAQASKNADTSVGAMGDSMKKVGNIAKVALAGAAAGAVLKLVGFAKDGIDAFSELEQATGSVESVFKEAAGSIITMSKTASSQFGLSASDFQQSAALLGSQLKNQLGLSVDETAVKVEELIGKASDMSATFGGTASEAIESMTSLLRGEFNPIEKYGASMNVASIEAHALANGVIASTTEMTPQIKAAEALDILFEQTADSTGQFARESETLAGKQQRLNARMENTKALVGEALAPAYSTALDLTGLLTGAVDELAVNFLIARGAMTEAEGALALWNDEVGDGVTSTDDFFDVLTDFGVNLERVGGGKGGFVQAASDAGAFGDEVSNLLDTLDPGVDTAREWAREVEAVGRALGLTQPQIEAGKEAFDDYIIAEGNAARDAGRHANDFERPGDAIEGVGTKADVARTALERYEDEIKSQTDPLYGYLSANQDVADAEAAAAAARDEFTADSPEYRAAVIDVAKANEDLVIASMEVAEQSDFTRGEFESHLVSMGNLTREQIDIILAEFDKVNAFQFSDHTLAVNVALRFPGGRAKALEDQIGTWLPGVQAGGPVMGGNPYIVGEAGPELFVPETSGNIVPNHLLGTATAGGGVSVVQNFYTEPTPTPQTQRAMQEAAAVIAMTQ